MNVREKKRLFLHVGLHKTGTTSIQWALTFSRNSLREAGFLYPETGAPDWARFGQHLLAWSVVERANYLPVFNGNRATLEADERDDLWSNLYREIDSSNSQNVILSSEEFDILTHTEIMKLGSRLERYDVTPILFLRNHTDLLESSYRTSIVYSGYRHDIRTFAADQRTRLDYSELIRDWRTIAANYAVIVVNYDEKQVRQDSVVAFLKQIGLDSDLLSPKARQNKNESVPAFICEIARFMRLKGCDETHVRKWITDMEQLKFPTSVLGQYCFMPADLRVELDHQYSFEVDKINNDSELRSMVRGHIRYDAHESQHVEIRNILDALLVLGRETSARWSS